MDSEPETSEQIVIEMSELDAAQEPENDENEEEQENTHPVMKHAEVTICVIPYRDASIICNIILIFVCSVDDGNHRSRMLDAYSHGYCW